MSSTKTLCCHPQNIKADRYCISHHADTPVGSFCFQSFHLHNPSTYSNYTFQTSIFMFHHQHLPVTTPLLFSNCQHCHVSTSTDTPTMECPNSGILSLCRCLKNRHYTNSKCPWQGGLFTFRPPQLQPVNSPKADRTVCSNTLWAGRASFKIRRLRRLSRGSADPREP